jgi:CheY-like chemotaxis protein
VGKGTGLGLSTVYGITQQSGGHIEVDSELGRGTTFKVYLPCVDGVVNTPERRSDRPTGSYGGATVLLVEDNPAVRQMVGRILRERGYSVVEAAHPEEAIAAGERKGAHFDLVLTDVVMPKMSGPELVKHLRQQSTQMRVLYMSGYAGAAISRESAIETEAYIEKPFTPDSLVETVHALLNSAE